MGRFLNYKMTKVQLKYSFNKLKRIYSKGCLEWLKHQKTRLFVSQTDLRVNIQKKEDNLWSQSVHSIKTLFIKQEFFLTGSCYSSWIGATDTTWKCKTWRKTVPGEKKDIKYILVEETIASWLKSLWEDVFGGK